MNGTSDEGLRYLLGIYMNRFGDTPAPAKMLTRAGVTRQELDSFLRTGTASARVLNGLRDAAGD